MKRTDIPNMTPEQCDIELAMDGLKKLLQKARKADKKASDALAAVYSALEDMCIDIEVPSNAENAENLEEAVSCYIHYGEFGLANLLREIRQLYSKQN